MTNETLQYKWDHSGATEAHGHYLKPIIALLPKSTCLKIADLGCGNGYLASILAAMGHTVTAVDSSESGIALARESFPSVTFHCASLYEDLPSMLGTDFDVVVSSEVIEHLYDPRKFLKNAESILKPNGTLILTTPYHGYFKNLVMAVTGKLDKHFSAGWDCGHIKFFSVKTLSQMVAEFDFKDLRFSFAGRAPYLWKSMILKATKSTRGQHHEHSRA